MFAIYTPNGRTFTGTLESLRGIDKTQASNSVRGHNNTDDPNLSQKQAYLIPSKEIQAYRKTIHKTDDRELIRHVYQVMSSPVQGKRVKFIQR